jgi:hypothetical protein
MSVPLRGLTPLCVVITHALLLQGAPPASSSTTNTTPALAVRTADGEATAIKPASGAEIFFVTSYCPGSEQLMNFLNDPAIAPYLRGRQFRFVLHNEWPTVEQELRDSREYDAAAIRTMMAKLRSKSGSQYLLKPSTLAQLPGASYYGTWPLQITTIPTVWSTRGYSEVPEWIVQETGIPPKLALKILTKYKQESE